VETIRALGEHAQVEIDFRERFYVGAGGHWRKPGIVPSLTIRVPLERRYRHSRRAGRGPTLLRTGAKIGGLDSV
jgi:hypothetical protein